MARRANDPDLLRAQARGGRDGENAWRQAATQLTAQRQAAVQQAMQAAALRGTPGAAVAQLGNRVARPYNAAIRDTTQMAGVYGADMAAREGRMDDYGQAILAARQLIPLQIQQTVAPIRAENRYNLQALRQEGQNRIGEINAQTALQLAQLQAEIRKAELESGSGQTLTEGELQAALTQGARQQIDEASRAIGSALEQSKGKRSLNMIQDIIGQGMVATSATEQARQRTAADMYGAEYMAKALATMQGTFDPFAGSPVEEAPDVAQTRPSDVAPSQSDLTAMGYPAVTQDPRMIPFGANPNNYPVEMLPQISGPTATTPGGAAALPAPTTAPAAAPPTGTEIAGNQMMLQEQLRRAAESRVSEQDIGNRAYSLAATRPAVQPLGQFGGLTNRQVSNLSPYEQQLVVGAAEQGTPIMGPQNVSEVLYGAPTAIDPDTGLASVNPYARDVQDQAMQLAAAQLMGQGYDITMPEIQNAILNTGSLFDIEQGRVGAPTIAQQGQAAQDLAAASDEDKTALVEDRRTQMRKDFYDTFGVEMPEGAGDVEDIYQHTVAGEDATAFQAVINELDKILNADPTMDVDEAITQAFSTAGVPVTFPMRYLLKKMRA